MAECIFDFGPKLKALRKGRRLSQAQLAKALATPQTVISYIEARNELPRTALFEKVLKYFHLEPGDFYADRPLTASRQVDVIRYLSLLPHIKINPLALTQPLKRTEQGEGV